MNDEEAIELIRDAATRFSSANIAWSKARFGLLGIWVGSSYQATEKDPLLRTKESEQLWNKEKQETENPYNPIVTFLNCGGCFIRWEHNILDIRCPSGNKYGLPDNSFEKV